MVEEVMAGVTVVAVAVTDERYQGDRRECKVIGGRRGALVLPSGSGEITNRSTAPSSETSCIMHHRLFLKGTGYMEQVVCTDERIGDNAVVHILCDCTSPHHNRERFARFVLVGEFIA